jgi:shikimate dehydrogenase
MKKACVIGWPIAHSRSPLIHNYWLHTLGIEGSYSKEAVETSNVEAFLRSLASNGFAGCNVTVPHKEAAFQLAGVKEASAEAVGAANTLWLDNGKLVAANTDTYGFMSHLAACAPDWQGGTGPVCILGAGGAARAIAYGFLQAGANDVRIFNRSQGRARDLVAYFGSGVSAHAWEERHQHARESVVLVNTTSVGMKGEGSLGIDATKLQPRCVVADIVYVPLATDLLRDARAAGLRTVDGLGMLLHQAVPGFERWFGTRPAVTPELYSLIAADIEGA